jgi:hypothetical protein
VAACQTDLPNPIERRQMTVNTDRMLSMIDRPWPAAGRSFQCA